MEKTGRRVIEVLKVIMRAIGWPRNRIRCYLYIEAGIIWRLGGVLGILFAYGHPYLLLHPLAPILGCTAGDLCAHASYGLGYIVDIIFLR